MRLMKEYVKYTKELGQEICLEISNSTKGIKKLCDENPHWPSYRHIYKWTIDHPEFGNCYAQAKARQIEWLVEEMLEIAYDSSKDTLLGNEQRPKMDKEWVQRSRLKVDTIKWLATKLAPRLYGDKLHVEKIDISNDADLLKAREMANKLIGENDGRHHSTES